MDPYSVRYLDRYAEQFSDTILAKTPAVNLFQYSDLLRPAEAGDRSAWQMLPASFDLFEMMRECCGMPFSPEAKEPLVADVAAYALRLVDQVASELGTPVGLSSYRPYHSSGEDFLCDMVGMIGIPVEMYPQWPRAKTELLTETAKEDPGTVTEIEQHLRAGDKVVITSGLLRALQDQGLNQITDMRLTGHVLAPTSYVGGFGSGAGSQLAGSQNAILFPEVHFDTNGYWAVVRGLAGGRGVPLLLMDKYGEGTLYVWALPENLNDLYRLPSGVLDAIRRYLEPGLPVRLEGPAKVSLFAYDNGTFVAESYLDQPAAVRISAGFGHIQNLMTGVTLTGDPVTTRFSPPRRSETAQAPSPKFLDRWGVNIGDSRSWRIRERDLLTTISQA